MPSKGERTSVPQFYTRRKEKVAPTFYSQPYANAQLDFSVNYSLPDLFPQQLHQTVIELYWSQFLDISMASSSATATKAPSASMAANIAGVVTYASILKEVAGDTSLRNDFRFVRPADQLKFVTAEAPSGSSKIGEHLCRKLLVGTISPHHYGSSIISSQSVYAYVHKRANNAKYPEMNRVTFVIENGKWVFPAWVQMGFDFLGDGHGRWLSVFPLREEKLRFMVLFYFLEIGLLESFPEFGKGIAIFKQCCQTVAELARKEGKVLFRTEQTLSLKKCILPLRAEHGKNGASEHEESSPSSTPQTNPLNPACAEKLGDAPVQNTAVRTGSLNRSHPIKFESISQISIPGPATTQSRKRPGGEIEHTPNGAGGRTGSGDEMNAVRKKTKTEIENKERRLQELVASYESSTKELEAAKAQLKLPARENLDKEEQIKKMEEEMHRYRNLIHTLQDEKAREQREKTDMEFKLWDMDRQASKSVERMKSAETELARLKTQVETMEKEKQATDVELRRLHNFEEEAKAMRTEKHRVEAVNENLRDEIKSLKVFKDAVLAVTSTRP